MSIYQVAISFLLDKPLRTGHYKSNYKAIEPGVAIRDAYSDLLKILKTSGVTTLDLTLNINCFKCDRVKNNIVKVDKMKKVKI